MGGLGGIVVAAGDDIAPEQGLLPGEIGLETIGLGLDPVHGGVGPDDVLLPETGLQFPQIRCHGFRVTLPLGHFQAKVIIVKPCHHLPRLHQLTLVNEPLPYPPRNLEAHLHLGQLDGS